MSKRIAHKQKNSIVYMATNKVTGKRYVGITCRAISVRRSGHLYAAIKGNSQTYFHRAIRKYGKEQFEFVVLESCATYDAAAKLEIALIDSMKPEYNQTKGGDGYLGWSPSPEQRRSISERNKGRPGFWKGKKLPQHVCEQMIRRNASPERRLEWKINAALGPKSMQRMVVCLNDGVAYDSITQAAQAYGICGSAISAICNRNSNRKTAGGLVFRFFGEHHGGLEEAIQDRDIARKSQLKHIANGYRRAVICLDDGRRFSTVKEASEFYSVSCQTIICACKFRYKYKTKNSDRFRYESDVGVA